ncbi:MAG: NUDIX domain-containing protein, partial [Acidimicrobiales bacterium]
MPKASAGLLLYRLRPPGEVEVLLVHPGGPAWAKRDIGAWSVPKGELDPGEDPAAAAEREFAEELGTASPTGRRLDLGQVTQASGKVVTAWAAEGDLDTSAVVSNLFEMEWPPRSGRRASFPEVDRAEWFTLDEARRQINPAQEVLLDRLRDHLGPTD